MNRIATIPTRGVSSAPAEQSRITAAEKANAHLLSVLEGHVAALSARATEADMAWQGYPSVDATSEALEDAALDAMVDHDRAMSAWVTACALVTFRRDAVREFEQLQERRELPAQDRERWIALAQMGANGKRA